MFISDFDPKTGLLVEAGTYEGNFYGTPRPPRTPPEISLDEKINDLNGISLDLPSGWEMARTNSGKIYAYGIFRRFCLKRLIFIFRRQLKVSEV